VSYSIHHAIRAFRANSKQNWCGCAATLKEGGAVEMAHMGIGVSAPAERAAINREEDIYNEIKERHLGLVDRLGILVTLCFHGNFYLVSSPLQFFLSPNNLTKI
jgi:hypothetical protein